MSSHFPPINSPLPTPYSKDWLLRRAYLFFCTIVCTDQKPVSVHSNVLQPWVQIRREFFTTGELPHKKSLVEWFGCKKRFAFPKTDGDYIGNDRIQNSKETVWPWTIDLPLVLRVGRKRTKHTIWIARTLSFQKCHQTPAQTPPSTYLLPQFLLRCSPAWTCIVLLPFWVPVLTLLLLFSSSKI